MIKDKLTKKDRQNLKRKALDRDGLHQRLGTASRSKLSHSKLTQN